jgi:hypothetical protein
MTEAPPSKVTRLPGIERLHRQPNWRCELCHFWYENQTGANLDLRQPRQGQCKKDPPQMAPVYAVTQPPQVPGAPPFILQPAGFSVAPLVTMAEDFCHQYAARH